MLFRSHAHAAPQGLAERDQQRRQWDGRQRDHEEHRLPGLDLAHDRQHAGGRLDGGIPADAERLERGAGAAGVLPAGCLGPREPVRPRQRELSPHNPRPYDINFFVFI